MTPDELVRRSADEAAKLRERSARLSLEIERQFANKDGVLNYLLASAHQEAVEAFSKLATVEPSDVDSIRQYQNEIARYSDLAIWLSNAVISGHQAFKDLPPDVSDGFVTAFSASDEDN